MVPDRVEREVVIAAPVDVVWRMVTEPQEIERWFADDAKLEAAVGADGELRFTNHRSFTLRVEAVEPMRRFAFRWADAASSRPRERDSLLVEFTLREEGAGGTRLRVVESGFDQVDWSDAEMARYAEDHNRGWSTYLGRLRDLLQGAG